MFREYSIGFFVLLRFLEIFLQKWFAFSVSVESSSFGQVTGFVTESAMGATSPKMKTCSSELRKTSMN